MCDPGMIIQEWFKAWGRNGENTTHGPCSFNLGGVYYKYVQCVWLCVSVIEAIKEEAWMDLIQGRWLYNDEPHNHVIW